MSEIIKSALINCFSMLEERSFFPPTLPFLFPHVFLLISVMGQALQSIPKDTWSQVFGITLDVTFLSQLFPTSLTVSVLHPGVWHFIFFPSWDRNEFWTCNSLGEGPGPQTTPVSSVVWACGSCHVWNIHRVRHWLSGQIHAWPFALESGSTRQVSDGLPQDLNGFKTLIYCLYVHV